VLLNYHKLLIIDILMPEKCWARKKWNKVASDIKLVFHSSTITMMHGPIHIKNISFLLSDILRNSQQFSAFMAMNIWPCTFFISHTLMRFVILYQGSYETGFKMVHVCYLSHPCRVTYHYISSQSHSVVHAIITRSNAMLAYFIVWNFQFRFLIQTLDIKW